MQPLAADDVASSLADIYLDAPVNVTVELAGPESLSIAEFVGRFLTATGETRQVIADASALYSGARLDSQGLNPGPNPRLGKTTFAEWAAKPKG